ncbi:MAG: hypothetical protein F8N39_05800 [Clostridiaceae bacterium]|nr:hypothetical protein [Clostridiaceae bacterium]
MAATKTGSVVISAASSAPGSTYAAPSSGCQSAAQSTTSSYGAMWTIRLSNGASAPSTGCTVQVDVSIDGTTWRSFNAVLGGLSANTAYDFCIEVPAEVLSTRVTAFGNAGNAVTVYAELSQLTAI